jgi:diguanylate cyclase (GGDEF)-like protein
MSLLKQLFLAICLFLVVAFTGSFIASVENSREQSLNQLRSHAQDAATALALSMTPHVEDPVMLELLANSIFDSGYFSSIRVLRIPDGSPIVERNANIQPQQVPEWFAAIVNLPPQGGDALIMRGWEQAARIEVLSHPQFALAKLWDSTLATLLWLLVCGAVSALLGGWLLRSQLRPLDRMVEQAHSITQREFTTLPQLPRTPELRRVVQAMNQMVDKLKTLFAEEAERSEKLRQQAYQDDLTGLASRRLLDLRLSAQLAPDEHHAEGYLLLLQIHDLNGLNQRYGGQFSDRLIVAIGEQLMRLKSRRGRADWLAARNRGSEFVLLAPGLHQDEVAPLLETLSDELETLRPTGSTDSVPVAHIGVTAFRLGETPRDVLERADQALAQAQAGNSAWQLLNGYWVQPLRDQHSWHETLQQALADSALALYVQPVVLATAPAQILHHKVLARLPTPSGEPLTAGRFLPWLERLGWAARFDYIMLELVIARLKEAPQPLALSLSAATLRDARHLQQIFALLHSNPTETSQLILELDAQHLPVDTHLQHWSQKVRATGTRLGLQHFGGDFSKIGNLAHLGLAHVKVDGAYIRGIDNDEDKRLFIEAIYRTTNSIDLPLIAEMVETEGELRVLAELGVRGAMGHFLGAPIPWETSTRESSVSDS